MTLRRGYHRLRAFLGGYFWLPCPICHEPFGGHEVGAGMLMDSWSSGLAVCPQCGPEADRRNQDWMKAHPYPYPDPPIGHR